MANDFKQLCSDKALIKYIRRKPTKVVEGKKVKAAPVGVLLADAVPNADGISFDIKVGWSLCNKHDTFSREAGLSLAARRMIKNRCDNVPDSMKDELKKFQERCERYFKQPVAV